MHSFFLASSSRGCGSTASYRGDGDEHAVEAVPEAESALVGVAVVVPRVAGVLQEVAQAGRADDLYPKRIFWGKPCSRTPMLQAPTLLHSTVSNLCLHHVI